MDSLHEITTNAVFKKIEAGTDEAGRGCLAGPVSAAAVIFSENYSNPDLNDSKKLSEKKEMNLEK